MKKFDAHIALWLYFGVIICVGIPVFAQQPLLQDIKVYRESSEPNTLPTPPAPLAPPASLVRKTGSSEPAGGIPAAAPAPLKLANSRFPILAETPIPGYSGVIVESLEGDLIVESGSNIPLNPASNVKIATVYAVLKTLGPDHRFPTNVWTNGSYEAETATIRGNLYISGQDPVFTFEDAIRLANELNRMGIRNIEGDLIVSEGFVMNYNGAAVRSGQTLFTTLDAAKRSAAATRAWGAYRINSGNYYKLNEIPSVTFSGSVSVQPLPGDARLLFTHESAPLRNIIKVMMSYSNNFLAERLGYLVGGPYGIARIVQQNTGTTPAEFSIQTASGLGINRVTPAAMMKLLRTLRAELHNRGMTLADVMPVAGLDSGTLEDRFATDFSRGSVIGKTGTLGRTDGGVSALAGEINTRNGRLLFVIFNQHGSVSRFRSFQNYYVSLLQGQFGGASAITYNPIGLAALLAKTRLIYPETRPRIAPAL